MTHPEDDPPTKRLVHVSDYATGEYEFRRRNQDEDWSDWTTLYDIEEVKPLKSYTEIRKKLP